MNKFRVYGYDGSEQFEHVHKATARKAYNDGKTIAIDGCLMMPFNGWNTTFVMSKRDRIEQYGIEAENDCGFDELVRNFERYNCNSEQGRRAAFYVRVGDAK